MYSGYEIVFHGAGLWSFGNDFARDIVIFDVHNSSWSHADNCKNNFSVLPEGPTDDINSSIGIAEKKVCINFSKAKTKFCLSLHYKGIIIVIRLLTERNL